MSAENQMRLQRFKRAQAQDAPTFRLTERDIQIIQAVMNYRVLSTAQIRRLFFGVTSKSSQCDRRLKGLYHYGFLERQPQPTLHAGDNKPMLYSLTAKGAQLLREQSSESVSSFRWSRIKGSLRYHYFEHLLGVHDTRIAFMQACALLGFSMNKWIPEHEIRRAAFLCQKQAGNDKNVASLQVIPDGVCQFSTDNATHTLFIEFDQGSETLEKVFAKCQNYLTDHKSGKLAEQYQAETLRVLFVTTTAKRRKNILKKLQTLESNQHFAVTHRELVTAENVLTSPIWYQSGVSQPIALFRKRSIIPDAQEQGLQLSVERITEVFQDWWQSHAFSAISVEYGEQKLIASQDQPTIPTYLALGKWSGEQWLSMNYQFAATNKVVIIVARLLAPEETQQLRSRLYA